jgi:hypothetical protein
MQPQGSQMISGRFIGHDVTSTIETYAIVISTRSTGLAKKFFRRSISARLALCAEVVLSGLQRGG